jgi:hypothetical protein
MDIPTPDDRTFLRQVVGAFLKVFDDIKLRDEAILQLSAQNLPDIAVIDEVEFRKRVAEHEVNRQKVKRIEKMLENQEKNNEM